VARPMCVVIELPNGQVVTAVNVDWVEYQHKCQFDLVRSILEKVKKVPNAGSEEGAKRN
jgi:hypothetical protein